MATLAQTFNTTNIIGGMYLSAIGLFFKTKDPSAAISIEIRETDDGAPSKKIIPNSQVTLQPASVAVNDYAQTETKFSFPGPVILEEDKEYAIVVSSNSTNYNAWCATMGGAAVNAAVAISKQPNPGTMFISANGTVWVPDVMSDLMFKVYRANFTTNTNFNLQVKAKALPTVYAKGHILETTTSSSTVYFNVKNHGLFVNDKVSLSINNPSPSTFNGLTVTDINGAGGASVSKEYTVTYADQNSFGVDVGVNATATGICYVKSLALTVNAKADLVNIAARYIKPTGTECDFYIKTVSGRSRGGSQARYVPSVTFEKVDVNSDIEFSTPIMIPSIQNKAQFLPSTDALEIRSVLSTTNSNVSPILRQDLMIVTMVDQILDDEVTVPSRRFVAETDASNGTALAKYISTPVMLETKATSLKIMFAANIVTGNQVDVYYKISETDHLNGTEWVNIPYTNQMFSTTSGEMIDYDMEVQGLPEFKTFAIKLVMRGSNSCLCPRVSSLRALALAL